MSEDKNKKFDLKNHDKLVNMQQSEARLHWQRNNVFLIITGIMLLSLSQFNVLYFQLLISISGLVLNIGWLLIQQRSSSYLNLWKKEAKKLEKKHNIAPIFSGKTKGVQMRRIAYLLPLIFIFLWSGVIAFLMIT